MLGGDEAFGAGCGGWGEGEIVEACGYGWVERVELGLLHAVLASQRLYMCNFDLIARIRALWKCEKAARFSVGEIRCPD